MQPGNDFLEFCSSQKFLFNCMVMYTEDILQDNLLNFVFCICNKVTDFVSHPRVNPLTWVHDLCFWERVHNLGCIVHNEAWQLPLLLGQLHCQMSDKVFLEVQMVPMTAGN